MGIFDSFKIKKLINVLKDGEYDDAVKKATESLREIGKPAVEPLIQALKDKNEEVRGRVAAALEVIGKPAVEPLIQALKDKNDDVRWSAARALEVIGDERAVIER
jgi:HEAT repeat protein